MSRYPQPQQRQANGASAGEASNGSADQLTAVQLQYCKTDVDNLKTTVATLTQRLAELEIKAAQPCACSAGAQHNANATSSSSSANNAGVMEAGKATPIIREFKSFEKRIKQLESCVNTDDPAHINR